MNGPTTAWRTQYVHPSAWDRKFAAMTLPAMFAATAAKSPTAILTDFMGSQSSYAEIAKRARDFAGGLHGQGMAKGDRIGLFLPHREGLMVRASEFLIAP